MEAELWALMARQHGVATRDQARALGLSRKVERRMIDADELASPFPGVLTAGGAPITFRVRAMAAALSGGVMAVAHGAACRLHELDGFEGHDHVDVIGTNGAVPAPALRATFHQTRGPVVDHVVAVGGIPVVSVALTLALLAPVAGIGPTARALDSALRRGVPAAELRATATAWRQRGRSGPPALLVLLGERVDQQLPRSWFQHIAEGVLERAGIRLVDEHPVYDDRGDLLAELDLADPVRRVGVESRCWHSSVEAQHRDARRRGRLRQLGWEIVDVWWSDLRRPDRVIAEITYLLRSRSPFRTA